MNRVALLIMAASVIAGLGCAGEEEELGPPTATVCPEGSTLTYDNFAADFFSTYCTDCHSDTLSGQARQDAPSDDNFNTYAGAHAGLEEIDRTSGSGPDATNEIMPPADAVESDKIPSTADRAKLAEWIACGAPQN